MLFGLLARWICARPKATRVTFAMATTVLLFLFALLTIRQQRFYKSNEAFYQRAIDLDRTNVYAIDSFGTIDLESGAWDRAMRELRAAYQLAPSDPNAIYNLAHGYFETKQYAEAQPLFKLVANSPQLESHRKAILLALADTDMTLGNMSSGEDVLLDLERSTLNSGASPRLGILFQKEGRIREAQLEYHKEFQIAGDLQAERQSIALSND